MTKTLVWVCGKSRAVGSYSVCICRGHRDLTETVISSSRAILALLYTPSQALTASYRLSVRDLKLYTEILAQTATFLVTVLPFIAAVCNTRIPQAVCWTLCTKQGSV